MSEKVKTIHKQSREIYGARRIPQDLEEDDEPISRRRVGHLMKQLGLESKSKRIFKATSHSRHGRPVAPNLLDREFEADLTFHAMLGLIGMALNKHTNLAADNEAVSPLRTTPWSR